ncbi:MAG TPA: LytTR family transcriptional regulator DNA-binding domain-containing protein [Spirochaetota bacterium]|nr:LytTR family transcriptional regulator DNA-binding domain-containing protein [Spirochaetota bacterium]HPJ36107.1 LytTR family transcriptional regulator DNA-binding domain-containing protein [Spirochaetota bacterium]
MINVIIIDDEEPARVELKFLLEKYDDINIVAEGSDGEMAVKLCYDLKPDLVFMDIQMPALSGIEAAEILVNSGHPPYIIFVTAYDAYAIRAFELHAIDYLLKPVQTERLESSLERVRKLLGSDHEISTQLKAMREMLGGYSENRNSKIITVCRDEKFYPVPFEKIKYAYADDKKTFLVTTSGKFSYRNTLHHLEEILPEYFIRTHRSYIININFIRNIEPLFNGAYQITISDDDNPIPLSRSHSRSFKEIMQME